MKQETKNINLSNKFFSSLKTRRAVFFVLLAAVLMSGFSVKVSFAATITGNAPQPGSSLVNYPSWQQAIQNYNGSYKDELSKLVTNGTVPTSPSAYGSFLKAYGGYSWQEADKAGIQNVNNLVADPATNTFWARTFGYSDDYLLSKWKNGQDVPQPLPGQGVLAQSAMGYTQMANAAPKGIEDALLAPIIAALFAITYFLKYFVALAGSIVDITLNPSIYNFTGNQLIVQGWTMVRDVCNLFFLLVLLFIAICTILKIEKYHAKKTLLTLIIMALLINFSKPIAVFIFDGSQLLMNEFLKQMGIGNQQASTMFTNASTIANMIYQSIPNYKEASDSAALALQYLFSVVFLFMLLVAYLVIAIMLLIRIVAVMLLIIVSPLAFFAAIIPDFSKMSSQWWSALFEYSYFGPAAAFFLLLATKLSTALPSLVKQPQGSGTSVDQLVQNCLYYLTTIIFLYASIIMAKKFGGGAGAAIVGNANRLMKGAARIGGTGLLAAGTYGQYWRGRDMYQGTKKGISQQPGWRILTKDGRAAYTKERQERWEDRVAPFNIATARKKSEERKNDAEADIERDARNGVAAAVLQGVSRGGGLADRLMTDPHVLELLDRHEDLRNASYKHLRDNGQHHLQVNDEIRRRIGGPGVVNAPEMNEITTGMFRNSSPSAMFSDPNIREIVDQEGNHGGDYMLNRLAGLNDTQMLQRIRSNVKNPESMRVLNNLITWQGTIGPGGPTPAQLAALRGNLLA